MQHTKRLAFAVEMRSPTSGDEDDDQYGSEAQVETQEKMGSELSHKYQGPEWDGKKERFGACAHRDLSPQLSGKINS